MKLLFQLGMGDGGLGMGDWGWGIGDWGLGPIPNPQSPIPQSPIPNPQLKVEIINFKYIFRYELFSLSYSLFRVNIIRKR